MQLARLNRQRQLRHRHLRPLQARRSWPVEPVARMVAVIVAIAARSPSPLNLCRWIAAGFDYLPARCRCFGRRCAAGRRVGHAAAANSCWLVGRPNRQVGAGLAGWWPPGLDPSCLVGLLHRRLIFCFVVALYACLQACAEMTFATIFSVLIGALNLDSQMHFGSDRYCDPVRAWQTFAPAWQGPFWLARQILLRH